MPGARLGWHRGHEVWPRRGSVRAESRHPVPKRGAAAVIFKAVRDGAPYPDHHTTLKAWAEIPPRPIRLADLITTKRELALDKLLAEDSTFYGDLFPHVVEYQGALYL